MKLLVFGVVFFVIALGSFVVAKVKFDPKNGGDVFWYNFFMIFFSTFVGFCITVFGDEMKKKMLYAWEMRNADKVVPWK